MVDIIKTRAQLRDRAAIELGKLQTGQSLEQEDSDALDGFVDDLVARLARDSVVYIGDTEQIELEFFGSLAKLLACAACGSFGGAAALLSNNAAQSVGELIVREQQTLRRLSAAPPTREPVKAEYY